MTNPPSQPPASTQSETQGAYDLAHTVKGPNAWSPHDHLAVSFEDVSNLLAQLAAVTKERDDLFRKCDSKDWQLADYDRKYPEALRQLTAERARREAAEEALRDARASFLGLQPDTGGPIARQMGEAVKRINAALQALPTGETGSGG